ncbi:MAG: hypothetical protein U1E76_13455 [Planctomycetota bacterium]
MIRILERIFAENSSGEGTERTFTRLLKHQREQGSLVVLLVAEGARGDVQGLPLAQGRHGCACCGDSRGARPSHARIMPLILKKGQSP